jgi:hypothetical protein
MNSFKNSERAIFHVKVGEPGHAVSKGQLEELEARLKQKMPEAEFIVTGLAVEILRVQ